MTGERTKTGGRRAVLTPANPADAASARHGAGNGLPRPCEEFCCAGRR